MKGSKEESPALGSSSISGVDKASTTAETAGDGPDIRECSMGLQFPWKMHLLMDYVESKDKADIVSWILPEGQCFKIHDKQRFEKEVMPLFFKASSYKSFQRNLNVWGFESKNIKDGERRVIYHEFFRRKQPNLCQQMIRVGKIQKRDVDKNNVTEAKTGTRRGSPLDFSSPAAQPTSEQPSLSVPCGAMPNSHVGQGQQEYLQHRSSNQHLNGSSGRTPMLTSHQEEGTSTAGDPSSLFQALLLQAIQCRHDEKQAAAASAMSSRLSAAGGLNELQMLLHRGNIPVAGAPPSSSAQCWGQPSSLSGGAGLGASHLRSGRDNYGNSNKNNASPSEDVRSKWEHIPAMIKTLLEGASHQSSANGSFDADVGHVPAGVSSRDHCNIAEQATRPKKKSSGSSRKRRITDDVKPECAYEGSSDATRSINEDKSVTELAIEQALAQYGRSSSASSCNKNKKSRKRHKVHHNRVPAAPPVVAAALKHYSSSAVPDQGAITSVEPVPEESSLNLILQRSQKPPLNAVECWRQILNFKP